MKVLILEDEIPAQMQIKKLLNINYPEFEIKARENTKASLPIKEIEFVEELPVDPNASQDK